MRTFAEFRRDVSSVFCIAPLRPYREESLLAAGTAGDFGFVAGCIWGDDLTWKIERLDLSRVAEGKITRSAKFGSVDMPSNAKRLSECIHLIDYLPPEENWRSSSGRCQATIKNP